MISYLGNEHVLCKYFTANTDILEFLPETTNLN